MANKKPQGIRKKGDTWFINFRLGKFRKEVRVGNNYSQAVELRRKIEANKSLGSLTALVEQKPITYSEAIKEHWENQLQFRKSAKDLRSNLNGSEAVFGHRNINEIHWEEIEYFKNQRMKVLKPATVKRELGMMSSVFKRQVKKGRLLNNPVSKVDMPKFNNVRDRILSDQEFKRLLNVEWEVKDNGGTYKKTLEPHTRLALVIADYTAMRIGEVLRIRWSDVDLENDKIFVPDSKNGEKREVPIHNELKTILQMNRDTDAEYVINYKGQKVNSLRKSFMMARAKAKISNFRIHDLRHRAVTRWVQSGFPANVIMKASGHKTYAMFQRYTNLRGDDVMVLVGKKTAPLPLITQKDLQVIA